MFQKFKGIESTKTFWWYYKAKKGKLKLKLHRVKPTHSERIKILLCNNPRGKQNRRADWDVLKVVKITQRYSGLWHFVVRLVGTFFHKKNSTYILGRFHTLGKIIWNVIAITCKLPSNPASTLLFWSLPSDGQYIVYKNTFVAKPQ